MQTVVCAGLVFYPELSFLAGINISILINIFYEKDNLFLIHCLDNVVVSRLRNY